MGKLELKMSVGHCGLCYPRFRVAAAPLALLIFGSAGLQAATVRPQKAPTRTTAPATAATAQQRYDLDPVRSTLQFSFTQAGAVAQGSFRKLSAALSCVAVKQLPCAINVAVPIASLNTQDKDRDQLLRGAALFDVVRFPQAKFESTRFEASADATTVRVVGNLTIRDHSRPLSLLLRWRFATEGNAAVAYLSGETTLNRLDYGVGQGEWASTEWVANAVTVKFQLRLVAPRAQL